MDRMRREGSGRSRVGVAVGAILTVGLVACGSAAPTGTRTIATVSPTRIATPARYPVTTRVDIAYGPLPEEVLDLCLPVGSSTPRPGVVLLHGGGWIAGDQHQDDNTCSYLASMGFVAASINYRLAPAHIWPAQLVDAQLAVRWLRAQGPTIGLDPRRVCSLGDSAGGHLAVFLGVLAAIHRGDEAAVLATESPSVACVVDEFGPTDLAALNMTAYQLSIVHSLLGGATPQSDPALYRDASPLFDVSAQSAPTLIIQGTQDDVVPPSQSLALQQAFDRVHIPVQYVSYVGGHEYTGVDQQTRMRIDAQILAFLIAREQL